MSESQGAESSRRRRRGSSPAAHASPLRDDDLLREILVRLPPQPSSLPRASAVCKRWRCIVGDRRFHRQFHAHHQKPPLLGVFVWSNQGIKFNPILNERALGNLLGYDEDNDVLFCSVVDSIYMVQLKLMQARKLNEKCDHFAKTLYYPFKSFYTPGTAIAGGFNAAEMYPITPRSHG